MTAARFTVVRRVTDSGRASRFWFVVDRRGELPDWMFSKRSAEENERSARDAVRWLNIGCDKEG